MSVYSGRKFPGNSRATRYLWGVTYGDGGCRGSRLRAYPPHVVADLGGPAQIRAKTWFEHACDSRGSQERLWGASCAIQPETACARYRRCFSDAREPNHSNDFTESTGHRGNNHIKTYEKICDKHKLKFIPLAFDTLGRMHPDLLKAFAQCFHQPSSRFYQGAAPLAQRPVALLTWLS